MIWKKEFTLDGLNNTQNNMVKHLGIKFSRYILQKLGVLKYKTKMSSLNIDNLTKIALPK